MKCEERGPSNAASMAGGEISKKSVKNLEVWGMTMGFGS
jgi:methylmalonyl-CoA mutase cobalamin-binding subunit